MKTNFSFFDHFHLTSKHEILSKNQIFKMIIYNVTVKIDHSVHDDWLEWMKNVHIPDVMKTNLFSENRICRLLTVDESDGITYAVQYGCKDMATFDQYQKQFAPKLQRDHTERYGEKFAAFRTLMEIV